MTNMLLITGAVGVGKSSVADVLYDKISNNKEATIALINFDELTYYSPRPKDDPYGTKMGLKNLEKIWQNYNMAGINNLIIPYVIESQADIDDFTSCIVNANVYVVVLRANFETLKNRIISRPLSWDVDWHIKRAKQQIKIYQQSNIGNLYIDTNSKSLKDIAQTIMSNWQVL